jgi:UDPglucose 6-dehydrogenase
VVNNPMQACTDAHAVTILTEWDEFKNLDWQSIYDNMLKPAFLFDGRRLLDKKTKENIGFEFYAVGSS